MAKRGGGRGPTWLEWIVIAGIVLILAVAGRIIWMTPGGPSETVQSEPKLEIVPSSRPQSTREAAPDIQKAWSRLDKQRDAILALQRSQTITGARLKQHTDAAIEQSRRTADLNNWVLGIGTAVGLLFILLLGALFWLIRRLKREFNEIRGSIHALQQAEAPGSTAADAQLADRIASLESSMKKVNGRLDRIGSGVKEAGLSGLVTESPPPPPPPPDHWPRVREAAETMRNLLNLRKASPEEYARTVEDLPELWVITSRGIQEFSTDNQREHEIILFGFKDAMMALPTHWAVTTLSSSYSDLSRVEPWFHEWFEIRSHSGTSFEIERAAEASIENGVPGLRQKGKITLRG